MLSRLPTFARPRFGQEVLSDINRSRSGDIVSFSTDEHYVRTGEDSFCRFDQSQFVNGVFWPDHFIEEQELVDRCLDMMLEREKKESTSPSGACMYLTFTPTCV